MSDLSKEEMERFLHGQLDAWNAGDRDKFFGLYREFSPNGLHIEYVGKPDRDPWEVLETMWKDHNASMKVEAVKAIINGNEAACYHLNHITAAGVAIKTMEIYAFKDGKLSIRYFIDN